jgi:type III secretion system low calcium response chaperone LcrH/SycD
MDRRNFKIKPSVIKRLRDGSLAKKVLVKQIPVQEAVGFSEEAMAKFYAAAHGLFVAKHYADAADAFLFLVGLNPNKSDYWIGLGMGSQMNRDFYGAIDCYETAAMCELDYPVPYLYLGKCLFALHERETALAAFQLAIEYAGNIKEFHELKNVALKARDVLLREQGR